MKELDAAGVAAMVRPGMRVFVAGNVGEPGALLEALQANPSAAAGVTFVQFPLPGMNRFDFAALHPEARVEAFFMTPELRRGYEARQVRYVPMQMRRVFDWLRDGPRLDMAWLQVGPLGEKGRHPFAPSVDFAVGALANVDTVVCEVNAQVRASMLMPSLPPQRIDAFLRSDRPLLTAPVSRVDAASSAIGAQVAALIHDGDCIQTGIGAIPAAVLAALRDKNDLGMHSGLLDIAGGDLIRRGVMNGRRKTLDQGQHVTGMALGDAAFYEWVASVDAISFRPASHTHEISALRQIDDFVSINSAVEVDLFGQVNAEIVGTRQYSGTGGSVDFMRGAAASKRGRSVVALLATAREGQVSRIVPALERGVAATAARTDVDYIVTEYGVVRLFGMDLDARAQALIGIAAPAFRDRLREQWQQLRKAG